MDWNRDKLLTSVTIGHLGLSKLIKYFRKMLAQKDIIENVNINILFKEYSIQLISDSNECARLYYKIENNEGNLFSISGKTVCISFINQATFIQFLEECKNACEFFKGTLYIKIFSDNLLLLSHDNVYTNRMCYIDLAVGEKKLANHSNLTDDDFTVRINSIDLKFLASVDTDANIYFNSEVMDCVLDDLNSSYKITAPDCFRKEKIISLLNQAKQVFSEHIKKEAMGLISLPAEILKFFKDQVSRKKLKKKENGEYQIGGSDRFLNCQMMIENKRDTYNPKLFLFKNKKDKKHYTEFICYELLFRLTFGDSVEEHFMINRPSCNNNISRQNENLINLLSEENSFKADLLIVDNNLDPISGSRFIPSESRSNNNLPQSSNNDIEGLLNRMSSAVQNNIQSVGNRVQIIRDSEDSLLGSRDVVRIQPSDSKYNYLNSLMVNNANSNKIQNEQNPMNEQPNISINISVNKSLQGQSLHNNSSNNNNNSRSNQILNESNSRIHLSNNLNNITANNNFGINNNVNNNNVNNNILNETNQNIQQSNVPVNNSVNRPLQEHNINNINNNSGINNNNINNNVNANPSYKTGIKFASLINPFFTSNRQPVSKPLCKTENNNALKQLSSNNIDNNVAKSGSNKTESNILKPQSSNKTESNRSKSRPEPDCK
jgi:hypothetical protein